MASYQIPAPPPMSMKGELCANWKTFQQSWEYYVIATELTGKDNVVQAAALCSIMGQDCIKVMNSLTTLSADDKKKPEEILKRLGEHFIPKRHVLFERTKFQACTQTEHESVDQYVVRLRQLAETCEYDDLTDGLIRDRLCSGTRDHKTADRLINERPVPDLARCVESLRSSEMSRAHREQYQTSSASASETVHYSQKQRPRKAKPAHGGSQSLGKTPPKTPLVRQCKWCNLEHEMERSKCPAIGKTCGKCGKENHFSAACRTKGSRIHQLDDDIDDSDDSVFAIRRINSNYHPDKQQFMINMKFNAKGTSSSVATQLDTGATCSAMSLATLAEILQQESSKVKLLPTTGRIKLYDDSIVHPLGRYNLTVSCSDGTKHKMTFDILAKAPWPIIDGASCLKYGWITLNTVNMVDYRPIEKQKILENYQDVFTGLGCFAGEYHIDIDRDVRPVQHAPRRVPVPLKAKLRAKIDDMEKQGIIAKVSIPTDWISSLVAVQRPNKLRVCIDPRDLNKAIKRPKYQMPTLDEILPKLSKAKVFTVLDAKDGFFQVKLDEPSSYLTTFWTPFGRYRYLRMPQGICSAPEEYQRRQNELIDGLRGVDVIADDILCYGCGDTMTEALKDHDDNLIRLLERSRQSNLKFNKGKLRLRLTEVSYMGQLLTSEGMKPDPVKVDDLVNMPPPNDKKGVQRLLGCVNYLSRFMPDLSEKCEPLRKLIGKASSSCGKANKSTHSRPSRRVL